MNATAARRPLVALAAVVGLCTSMVLGAVPSPANAATELLVSLDGLTFAPTMTEGLFDDIGLMVPQDSETASFWVKNPTGDAASLRVSVKDLVVSSPALASSMTMTTWDEGTGASTTTPVGSLAQCAIIVPAQTIAAGADIRVDITLTMLDVGGSVAQGKIGSLNFVAAMRDAEVGPFPTTACDDDGVIIPADLPTHVAHTGSDLPSELLTAAGVLLGLGLLLVIGRRRRRDDEAVAE